MHRLYRRFADLLDSEDKDECVKFVLENLNEGELTPLSLYNEIITPAMYSDFCNDSEQGICVWKEHVRTAIVRTVIELSYPFVVGERDKREVFKNKSKVLVICPPEEQHELGARIVADFFALSGFNTTFSGANVPEDNIVEAVKLIKPRYIAISVTNYYVLLATKRLINKIRRHQEGLNPEIIIGGQACKANPGSCDIIGADMVMNSYEEIMKLGENQ